MTIPIKDVLGSISVIIAIVAFFPYLKDTIAKKNTPHPFSWLIWGVIGAIVFTAQFTQKGGAGSWSIGLVGFFCLIIFLFSLRGAGRPFVFPLVDWIALSAAVVAIVLWRMTHDPTGAVVLVTLADGIGYFPTFRKSIARPAEESISFFTLTVLSDTVSILALEHYALSTWLYPAAMVIMSGLLALFLLKRRSQLRTVSRTKNQVY